MSSRPRIFLFGMLLTALLFLAGPISELLAADVEFFVSITAGGRHSAGFKNDGTLWTWGENGYGQLGLGNGDDQYAPTLAGEDYVAVDAGNSFCLGLKSDGTLWSWGHGANGALGLGEPPYYYRYEGVYCVSTPTQVGEDFMAMAAGGSHSLGLKNDGTLWAWGYNNQGQLGTQTEDYRSFVPLEVGEDFTAVFAGGGHSLGFKSDGTLWAWGRNNDGQLGDGGSRYGSFSPVQIADDFIDIAAGGSHTLGLKADGSVWAWGSNDYGQVGDGSGVDQHSPVYLMGGDGDGSQRAMAPGGGFVAIAAGTSHSLALRNDRVLFAWGSNNYGQLGDGSRITRTTPVEVGEDFYAIAAGGSHSLGTKKDLSVWAWGYNDSGQLGDGGTIESPVPVLVDLGPKAELASKYYIPYCPDISNFALGFGVDNPDSEDADTRMRCRSEIGERLAYRELVVPNQGHAVYMASDIQSQSGWVEITASAPVKGIALAYGYGEDSMFDMDFKADTYRDLTAAHVDTGDGWVSKAMLANPNYSPATVGVTLHHDHGEPQSAQLIIPANGAVQYDLAALGNGSGWARFQSDIGIGGFALYDGRERGHNWTGGLSILPTKTPRSFASMDAGYASCMAIEQDGSLWAWGWNRDGQLGQGLNGDVYHPVQVGADFTGIVTGASHCLALKSDGSLWAWGSNEHGQVGDGTEVNRNAPVCIGQDFVSMAAGTSHSLALKTDGGLWAWGEDDFGQIGDGDGRNKGIPTHIGDDYVSIAAGYKHSLGVKSDGSLWAWGWNYDGQLGIGYADPMASTFREPVQVGTGYSAVAAGRYHSLGLKSDGTLWEWGGRGYGVDVGGLPSHWDSPVQIGEDFVAMDSQWNHNLALKSDGSLWAWGGNPYGQLGIGSLENAFSPVEVGEGYSAIAAGGEQSMALKPDGSLWVWGRNHYGTLGDGGTTDSAIPVRQGYVYDTPTDEGDYLYTVPYAPGEEGLYLGFGMTNAATIPAEILVEYYGNDGSSLGQDTATIAGKTHASFMSGVDGGGPGWARVRSSQPLYGMALVFGQDPDPMFDMDFKAQLSGELMAPHTETGAGWISKAMLANPNEIQAHVTVTSTLGGLGPATAELSIPAMGAVQYDLSEDFASGFGSVRVSSDQELAGFLLFDGRATGGNYLGGLSMEPLE